MSTSTVSKPDIRKTPGGYVRNINGELFGPFDSEQAALDFRHELVERREHIAASQLTSARVLAYDAIKLLDRAQSKRAMGAKHEARLSLTALDDALATLTGEGE